jgi:hypothetical protein
LAPTRRKEYHIIDLGFPLQRFFIHKTLMPDSFNIQMISQTAIAATTTYLIHCPTVFGSVRFSMLLLYPYFGW